MRKHLAITLVLIIASAGIAACGGDDDDKSSSSPSTDTSEAGISPGSVGVVDSAL